MLGSQNPVHIQHAPSGSKAIPLVLIHDGGGTVFSYHCLANLGRDVYGIHNPRFNSGRPWSGGIAQMGRLYAKLVQSVIPCGKILLGGWSFGGNLSLEVAMQLADSDVEVEGIVMIDSICPIALNQAVNDGKALHRAAATQHTRPEMRNMIERAMRQAGDLLGTWVIPQFGPRKDARDPRTAYSDTPVSMDESDRSSDRSSPDESFSAPMSRESSISVYSDADEPNNEQPSKLPDLDLVNLCLLPAAPRIVLLRCTEYVPMPPANDSSTVCRVDVSREMDCLGWQAHSKSLISRTTNIKGHHFNIFAKEFIHETSLEIQKACNWLDESRI